LLKPVCCPKVPVAQKQSVAHLQYCPCFFTGLPARLHGPSCCPPGCGPPRRPGGGSCCCSSWRWAAPTGLGPWQRAQGALAGPGGAAQRHGRCHVRGWAQQLLHMWLYAAHVAFCMSCCCSIVPLQAIAPGRPLIWRRQCITAPTACTTCMKLMCSSAGPA
jgi:hypothetical protein